MVEKALIREKDFELSHPVIVNGQTAHEPDISMAADGTVWIVWSERGRTGDMIRLRSYHDGVASAMLDCSTRQGIEFQPAIAYVDDAVHLAWAAFRDGCWHLVARTLRGGVFTDERIVISAPEGIFRPALLAADSGDCWLVCEVVEDRRPRLMVCRGDGNRWGNPARLSGPSAPCYRPSLAQGPESSVWVSYDAYQDGHYSVFLQRIDTDSAPLSVTTSGYHNLQSSLASDRQGRLWIAWASNQNDAFRDRWWMTKWAYLRCFDGDRFGDPVSAPPDKDVYNEDSFQGWEFPAVHVDPAGRVWVFGQSAHTLYAQYYAGEAWSPLYTIAPRHWGSWKPRVRVAGSNPLHLAAMGLQGAQWQRLSVRPGEVSAKTVAPREPLPVSTEPPQRPEERPAIVTAQGERLTVYFGDLHAHSIYSDATGDVDEFYHRYRDGYGYDFAALTDHDYLDGIELSLSELKMIWNHGDRMTVPGQFIALYGYEWTSPAIAEHAQEGDAVGEGHRHILYSDQTGPLISYGEESANTGKKLLARLKGTNALVIPHHTSWSGTDWDAHDEELQRLIEVCSTHGRFEYPGNQPIGYRRDHIHQDRFVLDGLARGYRLGFVGGSDSHGLRWHGAEMADRDSYIPAGTRVGWKEDAYRTGMTAVFAPELTREAILEALYHRRCYATSGVPIVLDFRINDHLMGSDIRVAGFPHLTCAVVGTAPIRSVDIVRSGHVFGGLACREGQGIRTLSFAMDDTIIIPGESHYYYARVTQEDGNMAWSSPIWVQVEG